MRSTTTRGLAAATGALVAGALAVPAATAGAATGPAAHRPQQHVLLLSVDGLHQSDLAWYAAAHPTSALASVLRGGVDYAQASTPAPSDSFPGMVGIR